MSQARPVANSTTRCAGVALISVLMVVTMVSISASWLLKEQHISIKRTTRIISQEQSILHVFGVENLAARVLQQDKNHHDFYTSWYPRDDDGDTRTDLKRELWSRNWKISRRNFREFNDLGVLKDIQIEFCIQDASGLLNLNLLHRGLLENKGRSASQIKQKIWNKETFMQTVLMNLLKSSYLGAEDDPKTPTPQQMVDALSDWLDEDDSVRPEGEENTYYLDLEPPYRTAAMRFSFPEEIYLVKGFNRKTTRDFMRYLTAIPYSLGNPKKAVLSKININTVPRKLLAALPGLADNEEDGTEGISGEEVSGILAEIEFNRLTSENPPFTSAGQLCQRVGGGIDHFCKGPPTGEEQKMNSPYTFWTRKRIGKNKHYTDYIAARSEYFILAVKVRLGDIENEMQTMLYRSPAKKVSVVQRRFGRGYYKQCTEAKAGLVKRGY